MLVVVVDFFFLGLSSFVAPVSALSLVDSAQFFLCKYCTVKFTALRCYDALALQDGDINCRRQNGTPCCVRCVAWPGGYSAE